MKNIIAIPYHNQNINDCLEVLSKQTIKPECILILNDHSDFLELNYLDKDLNIKIINCEKYGRSETRNLGFIEFLKLDANNLIFIDGDCKPENEKFIENYEFYLQSYDLIFGTRIHSKLDKNIILPASDLLTGNMDNLYSKKDLDYRDLRVISNAVEIFQNSKTFDEKIDLLLSGMISWSCNFAINRLAIINLMSFMKKTYNLNNCIFDINAFSIQWRL